jgi:hypothetical protein
MMTKSCFCTRFSSSGADVGPCLDEAPAGKCQKIN